MSFALGSFKSTQYFFFSVPFLTKASPTINTVLNNDAGTPMVYMLGESRDGGKREEDKKKGIII